MNCENCIYYKLIGKDKVGYCLRFPPIAIQQKDGNLASSFAAVRKEWFCGEFKTSDNYELIDDSIFPTTIKKRVNKSHPLR